MSAGTGLAPGEREIEFAPAFPDDLKVKTGIGYLQPGGLVVHTGWSRPLDGAPNERSQHPAYAGVQCWTISTPDGHRASRFQYLTLPDAASAAARIVASLPSGLWTADTDTAALLPLALEASETPAMLPLTHKGKPHWGSGFGGDLADFWMPDTRAAYERMIAAHGRIPTNCQACTRTVRQQKRLGWMPRTSHWPLWSVQGHRGDLVRPHCYCAACMRIDVSMGTFGPGVDQEGETVPGSMAIYPYSAIPGVVDPDMDRGERPFAWFTYFLNEGGCVVIDERPGVRLWPTGVRHDDALFCETGVTGEFSVDDVTPGS
ncbi:hypothetical protein ABZT06_45920 [Streptomyces sp. NPDC005483]|uniref:hypothetical protein n=1 Tax=Streptomyces sp. NPDC005483 TaxID=3154882 RepID=UPI0033B2ED41